VTRLQTYTSSRPFTAYACVVEGEPQTKKWLLPPRPASTTAALLYKPLSPRLRPKNAHLFQGTGSALDLQMVKVDAACSTPYAKMFSRPSTAASATEAFEELQGKYGTFRSIDQHWSRLDKSSYWNAENRPRKGDKLQREHAPLLKAMRPATAPDEPRLMVGMKRTGTPADASWLPALHGTSRFKRPSTVDHSMLPTSTVWWYDSLQMSHTEDDGEWVKATEKVRHSTAEAEKLAFQKERWRAETLMRLLMEDEDLDDEEDTKSNLQVSTTRIANASRPSTSASEESLTTSMHSSRSQSRASSARSQPDSQPVRMRTSRKDTGSLVSREPSASATVRLPAVTSR
jgi:hypothetical protein